MPQQSEAQHDSHVRLFKNWFFYLWMMRHTG
jgi:hypothetical protein